VASNLHFSMKKIQKMIDSHEVGDFNRLARRFFGPKNPGPSSIPNLYRPSTPHICNCTTFMLLTRLPPQFLLPAWNARQLGALQQRAYKSDDNALFFRKPKSDVIPKPKNKAQYFSPDSKSRDAQSDREPSVLSLFEELFPEESETKWRAAERREEAERREQSQRLPAFPWWKTGQRDMSEHVDRDAGLHKKRENGFREEKPSGYLSLRKAEEGGSRSRTREEPSVLILNSATKTLEESDFFRLGPKGEHIEGWTSGIIKGRFYIGTSNQSSIQLTSIVQSFPRETTIPSVPSATTSSSSPTVPQQEPISTTYSAYGEQPRTKASGNVQESQVYRFLLDY
jgi:hypothetical protein